MVYFILIRLTKLECVKTKINGSKLNKTSSLAALIPVFSFGLWVLMNKDSKKQTSVKSLFIATIEVLP